MFVVEPSPERQQQVRAAAFAAGRPVAVFGYFLACASYYDGSRGADVDTIGAVALQCRLHQTKDSRLDSSQRVPHVR